MRHITTTLAAALALAGVSQAATAQSSTTPVSFGVSGGPSLPTTNGLNSGFQVAGHLGVRSRTNPLGVRFDVLYDDLGVERSSADLRTFAGTANLMVHLPSASGAIKPYLSGGIGIYNTKFTNTEAQTNAGLNAGFGLDFPMSGIVPFAELRFHSVFTDVRKTNFVPVVFGVRF